MPRHPDHSSVSESSSQGSSEGWEDVETAADRVEEPAAICLFCDETRPTPRELFSHCRDAHSFDWKVVVRKLRLDFYGRIKLVNYLRTCTAASKEPDYECKEFLHGDRYLQPVQEDDVLLFGAEDEGDAEGELAEVDPQERVRELEEKLADISAQFRDYKRAVSEAYTRKLEGFVEEEIKERERDDDTHYFTSYAYNDIHEVMLKDAVRTDAYRDFIYGNKDLFKDKVVLDVGCGTGVLSMFCAKAGAKQVISVDNSSIIDKCRAHVFENGLADVIVCLRGKIEEVTLPIPQVDIIVSEWMGYCLLYEAMLNSVLYARDKYLAPDGLMVPSECRVLLAAVHDPDYLNDNINFWNHVYGFSMTAMKEKIREEVDVVHVSAGALASEPVAFCVLPLHTVRAEELVFTKPFVLEISKEIESLDGFLIYFDTYFTRDRDYVIPSDARAERWGGTEGAVAFTTGPCGKETHWREGFLLVDEGKNAPPKPGRSIRGSVTYREEKGNSRALEIEINWEHSGAAVSQTWYMR